MPPQYKDNLRSIQRKLAQLTLRYSTRQIQRGKYEAERTQLLAAQAALMPAPPVALTPSQQFQYDALKSLIAGGVLDPARLPNDLAGLCTRDPFEVAAAMTGAYMVTSGSPISLLDKFVDPSVLSRMAYMPQVLSRSKLVSAFWSLPAQGEFYGQSEVEVKYDNFTIANDNPFPGGGAERATSYRNIADREWHAHQGIVLCECDNLDCEYIVSVSYGDYMESSGQGGYYRLTHPGCGVGVLNATLVDRRPGYLVWTKMS